MFIFALKKKIFTMNCFTYKSKKELASFFQFWTNNIYTGMAHWAGGYTNTFKYCDSYYIKLVKNINA